MSNLNVKVKRILEDIIDVAYEDETEEARARYKRFYIEIINKERRTVGGWYMPDKKTIQVFNLSHGSGKTVKTCIHELAHHMDYCKNGKSGHQKPFYEEYRKLLYAALNMRIFTPEDVRTDNWSTDRNKVFKMLDTWEPEYVDYKIDDLSVVVFNAYEHRQLLKERGYSWDTIQQAWCKDLSPEEQSEELQFLEDNSFNYKITEGCELHIDAVAFIYAKGKTFDHKEELKAQGFYFDSKGQYPVWKKKTSYETAQSDIYKLRQNPDFKEVVFSVENK